MVSAAGAVSASATYSPAGQRSARHVPRVPGAEPARSSGVHRLGSRRERAEFSRLAVYAAGLRRVHHNPSGVINSAGALAVRMPNVSMPLGRSSPNRICSKIAYALDSSEFHRSHSPSTSAYGASLKCHPPRRMAAYSSIPLKNSAVQR